MAGRAIQFDPVDGSVVVTTNAEGEHSVDVALPRFDGESGALLEEGRWGGEADDEAHELVLDGEGGYDAMTMRFGMRPWRFPE